MYSLHLRLATIETIASILICTMLVGSVLISNVYAKGSRSEKSQYNLEESCNDTVKGKQITLTGSRSVADTETTTNNDAKVDKDAQKALDNGATKGNINTDFTATGQPNLGADGGLGILKNNKHIETPNTFTFLQDPNDHNSNKTLALNTKSDSKQDNTQEFKKSLPLKERRVFNVCNLPIGNFVDGFQYNEIDGTKKSDILLGTAAADDIKGKDGGDVIQARDDDDIVHGGKGDDSIQAGFGNDNIHGEMEMMSYSQDRMMIM